MFTVDNYKIVFKRLYHSNEYDENKTGRYDTACKIYVDDETKEVPRYTSVAKLHPNDQSDKIMGKKTALLKSMIKDIKWFTNARTNKLEKHIEWYFSKQDRTEIWKAFWAWTKTWKKKPESKLLDACLSVQHFHKAALEGRIPSDDSGDYWESVMSIVNEAVRNEKEN